MPRRRPFRFRYLLLLVIVAGGIPPRDLPGAAQDPPGLNEYLYPKDDLGAVYSPHSTTIKLWAPTAQAVGLILYADANSSASTSVPMSRDRDGVWSAILAGDQDGKHFLYEITHQEADAATPTVYHVNDPYARGSSANSGRTLIYDPTMTNPDGWATDHFVSLKQNVDAILYEGHVRDFSIHRSSGTSNEHLGNYLGVVQPGTRTPTGELSGIDHLKELGVTLRNHANGDAWKNILVVYNGNRQGLTLSIPGNWTVVANDKKAGLAAIESTTHKIQVEACSLIIAHAD